MTFRVFLHPPGSDSFPVHQDIHRPDNEAQEEEPSSPGWEHHHRKKHFAMEELDQRSLHPLVKHPEKKHVTPDRDLTPGPWIMTGLWGEYSTKELASQMII